MGVDPEVPGGMPVPQNGPPRSFALIVRKAPVLGATFLAGTLVPEAEHFWGQAQLRLAGWSQPVAKNRNMHERVWGQNWLASHLQEGTRCKHYNARIWPSDLPWEPDDWRRPDARGCSTQPVIILA